MRRGREEVPRSANEEEYVREPCGSFSGFTVFSCGGGSGVGVRQEEVVRV